MNKKERIISQKLNNGFHSLLADADTLQSGSFPSYTIRRKANKSHYHIILPLAGLLICLTAVLAFFNSYNNKHNIFFINSETDNMYNDSEGLNDENRIIIYADKIDYEVFYSNLNNEEPYYN